jgi:hypothetical protein
VTVDHFEGADLLRRQPRVERVQPQLPLGPGVDVDGFGKILQSGKVFPGKLKRGEN